MEYSAKYELLNSIETICGQYEGIFGLAIPNIYHQTIMNKSEAVVLDDIFGQERPYFHPGSKPLKRLYYTLLGKA